MDGGDDDLPDDDSGDNNGDSDDYYDESLGDTQGYIEEIVDGVLRFDNSSDSNLPSKRDWLTTHFRKKMVKKRRDVIQRSAARPLSMVRRDDGPVPNAPATPPLLPTNALPSLPSPLPDVPVAPSLPTSPPKPGNPVAGTTTRKGVAGTQAPAEAHAKTTQGKAACTPSPTQSLAPSAST